MAKPKTKRVKEVHMLYESDEWLSTDYRVLMGVFDTDHLESGCKKLIKSRANVNHRFYKDCGGSLNKRDYINAKIKELVDKGQTQGDTFNFLIETVTLNEYGEV